MGMARIRETKTDARADIQFNMAMIRAQEWFSSIRFDFEKGGRNQEYSYGYDPTEHTFERRDGAEVRILSRIKVHEVSPVLLGAGTNTRTLAAKSAQGEPLGAMLVRLRDEHDMTLEDMAMIGGVSMTAVNGILTGQHQQVAPALLERWARLFDVDAARLLSAAP